MIWVGQLLSAQISEESIAIRALHQGNSAPAVRLLQNGHPGKVSIEETADEEVSFLSVALQSRRVQAVRALLEAGQAFDLGRDFHQKSYDWVPAIASGSPEMVSLMLEFGADVHQAMLHRARREPSGSQTTPLLMAAEKNQVSIVRLLLEAGAQPNAAGFEFFLSPGEAVESFRFFTPLDKASDPAVLALLRESGGVPIHHQNIEGIPAVVRNNGLRLRNEPNLQAGVVRTLGAGIKATAVQSTARYASIDGHSGLWYNIVLSDRTSGWAFGRFLELAPLPWESGARRE